MNYFDFYLTSRKIAVIKERLSPNDPMLQVMSVLETVQTANSTTAPAPPPFNAADHPSLRRLPIHNKLLVTECHDEFRALVELGLPPINELPSWHQVRIGETYLAVKTCNKGSVDQARKKLSNTVQLLCELLIWMEEGFDTDDPQYCEWVSQGATDQHQLPQEFRMAPEFTSLVSITTLCESDPKPPPLTVPVYSVAGQPRIPMDPCLYAESTNYPTPAPSPSEFQEAANSDILFDLVSSTKKFLTKPRVTKV